MKKPTKSPQKSLSKKPTRLASESERVKKASAKQILEKVPTSPPLPAKTPKKAKAFVLSLFIIVIIALGAIFIWQKDLMISKNQEVVEGLSEELEQLKVEVNNQVVGGSPSLERHLYSIADEGLILLSTKDWDVYENEEYGYSFYYLEEAFSCEEPEPPCQGEDCKPPPPGTEIDEDTIWENQTKCVTTYKCIIEPENFGCTPPQIFITAYPDLNDLSLTDFCEKITPGYNCQEVNYEIADLSAIRYTTKLVSKEKEIVNGAPKSRPTVINDHIYFSTDDKNFMIRSHTDLSDQEGRILIETILESLEF